MKRKQIINSVYNKSINLYDKAKEDELLLITFLTNTLIKILIRFFYIVLMYYLILKVGSNMPRTEPKLPPIINFFYLLLIIDLRCNGSSINNFSSTTQKHFLPNAQQNAGDTCPSLEPLCKGNPRYYTIDGTCNNKEKPRLGRAISPFARILAANYSDGILKFRRSTDGSPLPNPRDITTSLFTDKNTFSNNLNILFYGFGQWVDHDITFTVPQISPTSCCIGTKRRPNPPASLCMPIHPKPTDYYYSRYGVTCVDIRRAISTETLKCPLKPIYPINFQTSWLDLSLVYGPSRIVTNSLRTFRGGQLKIGAVKQTDGQTFPPIIPLGCPYGGLTPIPGGSCLATGDPRLVQNPELTVNEVVLFRMHNHIASGLQKANPSWHDNTLFNEARKLLIAKYQHVTYNEMVPAMIGTNLAASYELLPQKRGFAKGYNPSVNGQVLAEFSAAAGRVLHSLVRGSTSYKDTKGRTRTYYLQDKYFNQEFLLEGNTFKNIIKSFGNSQCGAQDQYITTAVSNKLLLTQTKIFGQDLISIDINRGRDFGLPSYNTFREACGLCRINSFQDLAPIINNAAENIRILQTLYKNVNDIDYYVAGMLEKPVPGGLVGPTIACILAETYFRAKFGDRLFYEFSTSEFTEPQLQDIRKTTYSQFLCLTNNITSIPSQSFMIPSPKNPNVPCDTFGDTDYNLFTGESVKIPIKPNLKIP